MYSTSNNQPDYPAALASLQHMSSDQLKEILNNETRFDTFVRELPQMKALFDEKEMLLASNKSLAEYNLSQEPIIREGKAALLEKFQEASNLGEEVKSLKNSLDTKSGNMNPDTLLALLEAANQESEEESEKMMEDFISEGGSVDEFLENYYEKRKLAHLRRIKVDKMKELILNKKSTPSRTAPPPPGASRSPAQTAAPYPPYPTQGGYGQPALPYPNLPAYNMMPMPPSYR
jgi:ESCRT-I complex subunit VPS37